ncbi:Pfs NACHT ankyrin domain-containing protein [Podospora australis]|uniref:Pfs NACHT ankyrin domain-containing protein n=1 Tax=Podospora australis TaxID=1536484 RepID=A0AAN6WIX1_9PEZI|nr:Pfs NACHT ankyrin domain-containing protein [Podospora australis]
MMKFAYEREVQNQSQLSGTKMVLPFFFNGRGHALERTVVGMYRTLLYRLLEIERSLLLVFDEREHKRQLDKINSDLLDPKRGSRDVEWPRRLLQAILRGAISRLDKDRTLFLFVDALDECADTEDEVAEMVEYFEEIGGDAVAAGKQLRICISSRHYPQIDIEYGITLVLENEVGHDDDIAAYIQHKLRIGSGKPAQEIKEQVKTKARGIFMWVVLVVNILKAQYRRGRIFDLKNRLDALPSELTELFRDILHREGNDDDGGGGGSTDTRAERTRDLQLCVLWILFAARPLTLAEYYFAVVSGLEPTQLTAWDPEEVTSEDMGRFLLSSSKGLAEVIESGETHTVQFIHQSVREYFLTYGLYELQWLSDAHARDEQTRATVCHLQLWQCCHAYVTMEDDFFPDSFDVKGDNRTKQIASVKARYPFLEYATQSLLQHAEVAASSITAVADPYDQFLAWMPWKEFTEQYSWFRDPPARWVSDIFYFLAAHNCPNLIKAVKPPPPAWAKGRPDDYAIFAALAEGHVGAAVALLPIEDSDEEIVEVDINAVGQSQPPLCCAAGRGNIELVRLFLEKGADVNRLQQGKATALYWAVRGGHHRDIVDLLLQNGADPSLGLSCLRWVLEHYEPEASRMAMVKVLLEAGAPMHALPASSESALYFAAERNDVPLLKMMLQDYALGGRFYGINIFAAAGRVYEVDKWTPLLIALESGSGHGEAARVVIHGMRRYRHCYTPSGINWEGKEGAMALYTAIENGDKETVECLCSAGVDVDWRDENDGSTPLSYAMELAAEEEVDQERDGREGVVNVLVGYAAIDV